MQAQTQVPTEFQAPASLLTPGGLGFGLLFMLIVDNKMIVLFLEFLDEGTCMILHFGQQHV